MTETLSKHERNLGAIIHGSTLSRFFIPFGQFLVPLVLWLSNRNQYEFIDYHGKQALNFQISMTLYNFVAGLISIPFFFTWLPNFVRRGDINWTISSDDFFQLNFGPDWFSDSFAWWPLGITGLIGVALFIINIVFTIKATMQTNEGEYFRYPLTIKFIR